MVLFKLLKMRGMKTMQETKNLEAWKGGRSLRWKRERERNQSIEWKLYGVSFLLFKKKDNELIERLRKEVDGAGNEEVQRRCNDDDGEGGGGGEETGREGVQSHHQRFFVAQSKK